MEGAPMHAAASPILYSLPASLRSSITQQEAMLQEEAQHTGPSVVVSSPILYDPDRKNDPANGRGGAEHEAISTSHRHMSTHLQGEGLRHGAATEDSYVVSREDMEATLQLSPLSPPMFSVPGSMSVSPVASQIIGTHYASKEREGGCLRPEHLSHERRRLQLGGHSGHEGKAENEEEDEGEELLEIPPASARRRRGRHTVGQKAAYVVIVPASTENNGDNADPHTAARSPLASPPQSFPLSSLSSSSSSSSSCSFSSALFASLRSRGDDNIDAMAISTGQRGEGDGGGMQHARADRTNHTTPAEHLDLCVDDVSLSIPVFGWQPARRRLSLVSHVSAYIPSGTLCCVLSTYQRNASGLLAVIAGVEDSAEGTVLANALPTSASAFRPYVAYIGSVNGIDTEATVRSNLTFSIHMRITLTGGQGEEETRIGFATEMTLLSRFLETPAKELTRGQLFQLAIAMELVRDPAVVLLDAALPYFGQSEMQAFVSILANLLSDTTPADDSRTGGGDGRGNGPNDVASVVGRWAPSRSRRRVVVLSATDLPLPVYANADSLVVLDAAGRMLYSGETRAIESFFAKDLGIPNIYGEEVADLLAQMEDSHSTEAVSSKFHVSTAFKRVEERLQRHCRRATHGIILHSSHPALPPPLAAAAATVDRESPTDVGMNESVAHSFSLAVVAAVAPVYAKQLSVLTIFTLRKHFMRKAFLIPWACLLGVFVLLSSFLAFAGMGDSNAIQNISGVIFALLSCSMLVNTVFLDAEVEEYNTFVHQRSNSYFCVSQYAITTVLRIALPRLVIAVFATLFVLVLLRGEAAPLAVLMALTSIVHATLFIILVYWMPSRAALSKLWGAQHWYYGYCVVFSGFIVSLNSIPLVVQFTSLLRIGYGGLFASVMRGTSFGCGNETSSSDSAVGPSSSLSFSHSFSSVSFPSGSGTEAGGGNGTLAPFLCFTGDGYLDDRGMNAIGYGAAVGILFGATVALFMVLIISMYASRVPRRL